MKKRSGFSLVELLMVLGVMGILMGMLIPSVGVVRQKAQRLATAQKLRQISLAVATYQSVTGRSLTGSDMGDWMARLAAETGVRDGKLFIFEEDPLRAQVPGEIPPVLLVQDRRGNWTEIAEFEEWPLGVSVASGVNPMADPSTTPIAWTRGLRTDGTWQDLDGERPGVYGKEGGFIVFLDGHVQWYADLRSGGGRLVHAGTGHPTADIREALGTGTAAYDFLGRIF